VLSAAMVLAMTTWFSTSAVIPQLRDEWALTDGQAAWLTIAVQLGFVVGALLSSLFNLSDVVSSRIVILGGGVGAALVNAQLAAVDGPAAALPLRFATGFFLAGVYPPTLKLMATWFRENRGLALGLLVGALTVGSAGPHFVNGLGGLDWKTVVFVTSGLTVGGAALAFGVHEGPFPFPRATFDIRQAGRAFANRGVRLACFGYFGHMWELYAMWAWFLVFFSDALGTARTSAAFATFAVIGIGGVGCWAGGVLGDRWGRTATTAAAMVVSGTCAVTIGLLIDGPTWLVLVVGLAWGFSVVADSAQFSTIVTELADQAYVGTALALQLAIGFTLTVATIWLIPELVDAVGGAWAVAVLAPGPALGVLAMLVLRTSPEAAAIAGGRR
jgi:MFS family permease